MARKRAKSRFHSRGALSYCRAGVPIASTLNAARMSSNHSESGRPGSLAQRAPLLAATAALFLIAGLQPLPAQGVSGDYLLAVDGNGILSLALHADASGRFTGSVS